MHFGGQNYSKIKGSPTTLKKNKIQECVKARWRITEGRYKKKE